MVNEFTKDISCLAFATTHRVTRDSGDECVSSTVGMNESPKFYKAPVTFAQTLYSIRLVLEGIIESVPS